MKDCIKSTSNRIFPMLDRAVTTTKTAVPLIVGAISGGAAALSRRAAIARIGRQSIANEDQHLQSEVGIVGSPNRIFAMSLMAAGLLVVVIALLFLPKQPPGNAGFIAVNGSVSKDINGTARESGAAGAVSDDVFIEDITLRAVSALRRESVERSD